MAAASIVFPPPPTSNSLSYRQKAQLMRSTKKLGQVLGYTPHFLDRGHSRMQSPCFEDWSEDEEDWYRPASRGSTRTATSTGTGYSSGGSTSTVSSRHTRSSSSSHSTRFTKSSKSSYTHDSWSSNDAKPPLLRLALSLPYRNSQPNSPTSSNTSDEEDARFTLAPLADERNPRDSLVSPTFRIPTATTVRLQKMDRIRKKLGEGVPVELVFPDADAVKADVKPKRIRSVTTTVIEIPATTLPPLPALPPVSRPTKTRNAARDSIHSSSAHRAQRVKRKPVPKLEPSRSAPPPPTVAPKKGDRLSLILEEQGVSFVVVSAAPSSRRRAEPTSPASQWYSEEEQWVDYNTLLKLSEHSP